MFEAMSFRPIRSPLIYQGNKFKLLDFLVKRMPKATYAYDMFGGSGTVAANMALTKKFKQVHYVELDYNVERIVTALAQTPAKKTIQLV